MGKEREGWWHDPSWRQHSGSKIAIFFIVAAIGGEINVKLRQSAAIIYMLGLTAMWHDRSKAEHNGFSCGTMVILMVMIILIQFWHVDICLKMHLGS